jgi:hypothetical protein
MKARMNDEGIVTDGPFVLTITMFFTLHNQ